MAEQTGDVEVTDNPERSRFEVHLDGALAGLADYRLHQNRLVFTHTEVEPGYQGHGLAGKLARAGLETARERGLRVTPLCSYIADYIRKHPEYVPLVDERHRGEFAEAGAE